jgi:hypothetical protein
MGKSNRAATSLDRVLSSGINNCRLFVVTLGFDITPEFAFSFASLALARSRKGKKIKFYRKIFNAQTYLVVRVSILEFFDTFHHHIIV